MTRNSRTQAQAVAAHSRATGTLIPVLIEVDSDGHRSGVRADDPLLLEVARDLGAAAVRGVMTHAGNSYNQPGAAAITAAAEQERDAAVTAANRLRSAGFASPIVSVGSTPTADQGYGIVCDIRGVPFEDLIMTQANQEHGVIAVRPDSSRPLPALPVGTMVRILPNHACATGAQHERYHVVDGENRLTATWSRFSGW